MVECPRAEEVGLPPMRAAVVAEVPEEVEEATCSAPAMMVKSGAGALLTTKGRVTTDGMATNELSTATQISDQTAEGEKTTESSLNSSSTTTRLPLTT